MANHRKFPVRLTDLASAYAVTKQTACELIRKHGYDATACPHRLWVTLLEKGNYGPLRTRLSDPRFRQSAAKQLASLAKP